MYHMPEKLDKVLHIRLPNELLLKLKIQAEKERKKVGRLAREILEWGMK